jgi:hypothetical protein
MAPVDPETRATRADAAGAARDALAAARHPAAAEALRVCAAEERGAAPDARDVERVCAALTLLFVTAREDDEAQRLRLAYESFKERFAPPPPA